MDTASTEPGFTKYEKLLRHCSLQALLEYVARAEEERGTYTDISELAEAPTVPCEAWESEEDTYLPPTLFSEVW